MLSLSHTSGQFCPSVLVLQYRYIVLSSIWFSLYYILFLVCCWVACIFSFPQLFAHFSTSFFHLLVPKFRLKSMASFDLLFSLVCSLSFKVLHSISTLSPLRCFDSAYSKSSSIHFLNWSRYSRSNLFFLFVYFFTHFSEPIGSLLILSYGHYHNQHLDSCMTSLQHFCICALPLYSLFETLPDLLAFSKYFSFFYVHWNMY